MSPPDSPTLGFIGAGRMGTALAWGLARRGYAVAAVSSRSPDSAGRLAAGIAGCRTMPDPQVLADSVGLVMLTVPDDAIAATCAGLRWRAGQAVVHCSGATELRALAPAASSGAHTGGFHPLQMFTEPETALRGLPGCTIAVEAEQPLLETLSAMAEALGCHTLRLPPGKRALYHAGAGYVAAFVNALVKDALAVWSPLGLSQTDAIRALLPLLRGTADSIERSGPALGMAGPVSRGDLGTVEEHVRALRALDAGLLDLYRRLALRTVALGIERGSLAPEKAAALRALLQEKLGSE
jgi:predicted short-subunit dehydrogenase-like oxidoreductase (DUF2520 family)